MTKPPCKKDGIECPKRYIGCRAECQAYHKWMAKHQEEKRNEYNDRHNEALNVIVKTCAKYKDRRGKYGKGG